MVKEINILSRDFYPDNSAVARLLTELAEDLSKEFIINVFAGYPFYYSNNLPKDLKNRNIKIKRIWCTNFSKDNLFFRTINEIIFAVNIFFRVLFSKNRLNIIPSLPFILQLTVLLLNKIRNQEYILINYEVIPELLAAIDVVKKDSLKYKILYYLSGKVIDNSKFTISIGNCMTKLLNKKTKHPEKIRFIPNWADSRKIIPIPKDKNEFLIRNNLTDKFIVSFSGNLGRYTDIESVLKAAKELEDVIFVFIGGGKKKEIVLEFKNKLNNILFFDYLPAEEVKYSLNCGDIALVLMTKEAKGCVVPSKIYELMAAGKPLIIVSAEGTELENIIEKAKNGFIIRPKDYRSIKEAILRLKKDKQLLEEMGKNSRDYAVKNFEKKRITDKYLDILRKI